MDEIKKLQLQGINAIWGTCDVKTEKEDLYKIRLRGSSEFFYLKKNGTNLHKLFHQGYSLAFTYDEEHIIQGIATNYGGSCLCHNESGKEIHLVNSRVNWIKDNRIGFPLKIKMLNYETRLVFTNNKGLSRDDNMLMFVSHYWPFKNAFNTEILDLVKIHPKEVKKKTDVIPFPKAV